MKKMIGLLFVKEAIGLLFVHVLFAIFAALSVPYAYLFSARSWYWGGWPAMLLLALGLYCYLVIAGVRKK